MFAAVAILLGLGVLFLVLRRVLAAPWWLKIVTARPSCTYYFGPFASAGEAKRFQAGYLEDLQEEGAIAISVTVERGRPKELTIEEEEEKW
ncbi:MAG: DUF1816 domain-containing protein [Chloroflexaceae bacterium]|nr:DUF1816 domain-containing protein [Chloroflexaceae bacterium]